MNKAKKRKLYQVDWYTDDGYLYRTTMGCEWKDVKQCKKQARKLGETIKYEPYFE